MCAQHGATLDCTAAYELGHERHGDCHGASAAALKAERVLHPGRAGRAAGGGTEEAKAAHDLQQAGGQAAGKAVRSRAKRRSRSSASHPGGSCAAAQRQDRRVEDDGKRYQTSTQSRAADTTAEREDAPSDVFQRHSRAARRASRTDSKSSGRRPRPTYSQLPAAADTKRCESAHDVGDGTPAQKGEPPLGAARRGLAGGAHHPGRPVHGPLVRVKLEVQQPSTSEIRAVHIQT
ncbi:hypothetical protein ON010_g10912 [Phytophthora cinnamomi]|nr:hypothetical protein ON010_g10912 [Phytophthora cinnamomi]